MFMFTIKLKVIVAFVVAAALAIAGLYSTSRAAYQRNVTALNRQSLEMSRHNFAHLGSAEVAKMQSIVTTIVANPAIVSKISIGQRDELLKITLPLFRQLKEEQGVTNFNYIDADEKRILVMTDPADPKLIGTRAVRFNIQDSARTKTWSYGLGQGFHGLALRVTHPVRDAGQLNLGKIVGFVELGVEISSFVTKLKALTGNEYGLLVKKQYLNAEKWSAGRAKVGLRNNWDDQQDVVVASNTTEHEDILRLQAEVTSVPDEGLTLGIVEVAGHQFARSAFPVRDAAKEKIGAVFVLTDVTQITSELRQTLTRTIAVSIVLVVALMASLILILRKLVFQRLNAISRVATRVVGGDFETPIHIGVKDEIGRFEELLEQFRVVVVSLIGDMMKLQQAEDSRKNSSE